MIRLASEIAFWMFVAGVILAGVRRLQGIAALFLLISIFLFLLSGIGYLAKKFLGPLFFPAHRVPKRRDIFSDAHNRVTGAHEEGEKKQSDQ